MIGWLMNKEVRRMLAVGGDCFVQGNPRPAKKDWRNPGQISQD